MKNISLDNVETITDLGVVFDPQLNFAEHINVKVTKATNMLGLIKRNFNRMSSKCLTGTSEITHGVC